MLLTVGFIQFLVNPCLFQWNNEKQKESYICLFLEEHFKFSGEFPLSTVDNKNCTTLKQEIVANESRCEGIIVIQEKNYFMNLSTFPEEETEAALC